jgi:hypothetical protein
MLRKRITITELIIHTTTMGIIIIVEAGIMVTTVTTSGHSRRSENRERLLKRPFRNWLSGVQLIEQRLCLLQIARVEAFSEPAVNRSKQFASFLHLALVPPEARKAHGGAEFP